MKWISIAVLLIVLGCGQQRNRFNRFLDNCNRVDIVVFNGGDSLFFDTQDSTGIHILKNVITGNPNLLKDTCAPLGYLRYRQDSTVLFQARFAAGKNSCNYVAYSDDDHNYAHRLSDRANKLLNKVLEQTKKQ